MQQICSVPLRLLLVEADLQDALIIERELRQDLRPRADVEWVIRLEDCLSKLSMDEYDVVLLDLNLPDCTGLECLDRVVKSTESAAIVVLAGHDDTELGVAAVAAGAHDYLSKDQLGTPLLAKTVRFGCERRRLLREREEARSELIQATAHEQVRIARELHDGVCQIITAAAFKSKSLLDWLHHDNQQQYAGSAAEVKHLLEQVATELRACVRGLAPPELSHHGLPTALGNLAQQWQSSNGIKCTYHAVGRLKIPKPQVALQLYRIGQEAMHNAVRHSQADAINLFLRSDPQQLALQVQDNGCGFDPQRKLQSTQHWGLRSMLNRAGSIGGKLTIRSKLGDGTTVSCTVPAAQLKETRRNQLAYT